MKKFNKNDLVEMISEKAKLSKRDSREAIDCAIDFIIAALLDGQDVNLTNFGVFELKTRVGRVGTHPKNHNKIDIEPTNTILFRVSKSLKDKLNNR
jgi:DNA-binding protein HU-beta